MRAWSPSKRPDEDRKGQQRYIQGEFDSGPVDILKDCDLAETIIQSVSTQRLCLVGFSEDELLLDQLQTSAVTFLFTIKSRRHNGP